MVTLLKDLPDGSAFAGAFTIERGLGDESPGSALYVAEHTATGRRCALRVFDPRRVASPEGRAWFDALRRVRARIESDHVVDVIAADIDAETGAPWLAMPYLEGETLEASATGVLDAYDALGYLEQVAHALAASHAAGLVCGRLDPSHVLVAKSRYAGSPSTATLLDFWTHDGDASNDAVLRWRAPEQSRKDAEVGPAADVWAFGLLAFRLLTGKVYWKASRRGDKSSLAKEIAAPREAASTRARQLGCGAVIPDGFDAWFARCVAASADERFPAMGAALEALSPILEGRPRDDAPPPRDEPRPARTAAPQVQRAPQVPRVPAMPAWARTPDVMVPGGLFIALMLALAVRTGLARYRMRARAAARPAAVAPAAAPATPVAPAAPATPPVFDPSAEARLASSLAGGRGSPVWITVAASDPAAISMAERMRAVFERTGWEVHPLQRSSVRARPGVFLFVGDATPPRYVDTARRALDDAGLAPTVAFDYRSYYDESMRTRPAFQGFPFEPGQTFVIVVGRGE